MKWWQDLMVWVVILLVMFAVGAASYYQGIDKVVENCDTYRAYKVDETKVVFCMVMPITEQRGVGEKEYLRPDGVKLNSIFKRT
jgi:hypothetical protein